MEFKEIYADTDSAISLSEYKGLLNSVYGRQVGMRMKRDYIVIHREVYDKDENKLIKPTVIFKDSIIAIECTASDKAVITTHATFYDTTDCYTQIVRQMLT